MNDTYTMNDILLGQKWRAKNFQRLKKDYPLEGYIRWLWKSVIGITAESGKCSANIDKEIFLKLYDKVENAKVIQVQAIEINGKPFTVMENCKGLLREIVSEPASISAT